LLPISLTLPPQPPGFVFAAVGVPAWGWLPRSRQRRQEESPGRAMTAEIHQCFYLLNTLISPRNVLVKKKQKKHPHFLKTT